MNEQDNQVEAVEAVEPKTKKGGRKPKAEVTAPEGKPQTIYVQYQDSEVDIDDLLEKARVAFKGDKKRAPKITDLKLYIKPEERAAYYVINGKVDGKVEY